MWSTGISLAYAQGIWDAGMYFPPRLEGQEYRASYAEGYSHGSKQRGCSKCKSHIRGFRWRGPLSFTMQVCECNEYAWRMAGWDKV